MKKIILIVILSGLLRPTHCRHCSPPVSYCKSHQLELSNLPVRCGSHLSKLGSAAKAPHIKYDNAHVDSTYTLIMVDPDVSSPYWLHWLVKDIKGSDIKRGYLKGNQAVAYHAPTPPSGTGSHRYQFILLQQTGQVIKHIPKGDRRSGFNLHKFMKANDLCTTAATFQYRAKSDKYI